MWSVLRELRIRADWWLKSRLPWSAAVRIRSVGELAPHLEALPAPQRARAEELDGRYDLSAWGACCDEQDVLLNLYHLDILDQHMSDLPVPNSALDVGCRAWWNLPGNHSFRSCPWLGVELDGHQRYVDGSTRAALASFRAERFPGATYRTASVTEVSGPFDLIVWLLPYITHGAFDADRLPSGHFQPEALLDHALDLLSSGGTLLLINQGEEEARVQRELLAARDVEVVELGLLQSVFPAFDTERFAFRCSVNRAGGVEGGR